MAKSPVKLVLASASPRRTWILGQLGIPHEVDPAHIDETVVPDTDPTHLVLELSALKAELTLSRRAVEDMARTQSETVLPAVGEWRDMKTTGLRLVGVLAIGGCAA